LEGTSRFQGEKTAICFGFFRGGDENSPAGNLAYLPNWAEFAEFVRKMWSKERA
jgi:hypothetical protein